MKYIHSLRFTLAAIALATFGLSATAADISREVRIQGDGVDLQSGGYFTVGVGINVWRGIFLNKDANDLDYSGVGGSVLINGAYRLGGFFFEADSNTQDGLNLGYTVWNNRHWVADVLFSVQGSFSAGDEKYHVAGQDQTEAQRSNNLLDRIEDDHLLTGAGLRVTGYLSDYIVQYRLLTDIHKGNGIFSTLRLGRSWQKRNWNLYGVVSAEYMSENINDYLLGVSEAEATERFSEFHASAGTRGTIKLGATYPLGEHWVADASATVGSLTSAQRSSPLTDDANYIAYAQLSISYVF